MEVRFIEYQEQIFIVIGQGYNSNYNPPEIFVAIPLEESLIKSYITNLYSINIPLDKAIEITDKKRIKTIMVLYGR